MSHPRRRLPHPLLLLAAIAALLLPRLPVRAQDQQPPLPDLQALGVPMDQLPHAEALLQAELDKIKAAGEPLTLAEMAPPLVPDDENAALVYLEAFDALKLAPPGTLTAAPKPAPIAPSAPPQIPGAGGPPPPDQNTPAPPKPPPPPLPPEVAPALPIAANDEEYVAGNAEAIALLDQAAALPRCRWPQDWTKGPAMTFPYYANLREFARLLATKTRVEARDGHPDEALRTCGTSLAMVLALKDEPMLHVSLGRYGITAISLDGLRVALGVEMPVRPGAPPAEAANLPHAAASTAACQAACEQLAQVDLAATMRRAMKCERTMVLSGADQMRTDARKAREWLPEEEALQWEALYATPQGKQVLALDETAYLKSEAEMIKEVDRCWLQARVPLAEIEARVKALPPYCPLTKNTTPTLSHFLQKRDQCAADLARGQIALALVACHNETGQWPATLDQLRKVMKWDLPVDPFSGKDFIYRREGEGWILYSIGPDLKDDGGAAWPGPRDANGVSTGDLVWRRR